MIQHIYIDIHCMPFNSFWCECARRRIEQHYSAVADKHIQTPVLGTKSLCKRHNRLYRERERERERERAEERESRRERERAEERERERERDRMEQSASKRG
jgi:signal transduction histidine kinase